MAQHTVFARGAGIARVGDPEQTTAPTTPPAPIEAPKTPLPESVIGEELTINGDIASTGAIRVDGVVRGDISCDSITITPNGSVEGRITARRISVRGRVTGGITGGRVMIYTSAVIDADILHQGIGIEMGTRFEGRLRWNDGAGEPSEFSDRATTTPVEQPSEAVDETDRGGESTLFGARRAALV